MRDLTPQQRRMLDLLKRGRVAEARALPGWGKTLASLRARGLVDETMQPTKER